MNTVRRYWRWSQQPRIAAMLDLVIVATSLTYAVALHLGGAADKWPALLVVNAVAWFADAVRCGIRHERQVRTRLVEALQRQVRQGVSAGQGGV